MRTLVGLMAFALLAWPCRAAQEFPETVSTLSGLEGRVIAGGRPIDFLVEVRLESEIGRVIAIAGTLDGFGEFSFGNVQVENDERLFVVIEADGYEEVRQRLDSSNFFNGAFAGQMNFFLTPKAPEDGTEDDAGPRAVDVRQLTAEISDEAREEYAAAMEALDGGDRQEALRSLERAVELAPDYYEALNKLGVEYLNAGRYRDAEGPLERARDLNANDPGPWINLGTLYFQEGQALEAGGDPARGQPSFERAAEVLEEAVRLDPQIARASYYLGSALYELDEWALAEPLLLRALELDAGLGDARMALVMVYTQQGLYAEALTQIAAYLDANPDSPQREPLENLRDQIEGVLNPPSPPGDDQ